MGYPLLAGSLLLGGGPLLAVFLIFVANYPALVLCSIYSAFFWLCSVSVSAGVWQMVPPLKDVLFVTLPVGVLIQELFRYLFFRSYVKAESALADFSLLGPLDKLSPSPALAGLLHDAAVALASGLGFGVMYFVILIVPILSVGGGPGALPAPLCGPISFFVSLAVYAGAASALQVLLMFLAFDAYRRSSVPRVCLVVGLHLAFSLWSTSNKLNTTCFLTMGVGWLALLPAAVVAAYVLVENLHAHSHRAAAVDAY